MATSGSRLLTLLSLLSTRGAWSGHDLADRLEVSTRTLRRDLESLRELGYPIESAKGPDGGYGLGSGSRLPPLLLDDEQAVAVAVALQTAPSSIAGIDEGVARALSSIKQIMPAHLRAEVDAMHLTSIRNVWEFSAPPIAKNTLKAVGDAVRRSVELRMEYLPADGRRREPGEPDFVPVLRVEPHHLVMWAGRWYLVGYALQDERWTIYRVDRIVSPTPTGTTFKDRQLPESDVAKYVRTSYDRGDTPARWQCLGSVFMALPATVVARWAPGGSVVEYVSETHSRLTLGAWSWAGIAGLLATFDADISNVEPKELREACARLSQRFQRITDAESMESSV